MLLVRTVCIYLVIYIYVYVCTQKICASEPLRVVFLFDQHLMSQCMICHVEKNDEQRMSTSEREIEEDETREGRKGREREKIALPL